MICTVCRVCRMTGIVYSVWCPSVVCMVCDSILYGPCSVWCTWCVTVGYVVCVSVYSV